MLFEQTRQGDGGGPRLGPATFGYAERDRTTGGGGAKQTVRLSSIQFGEQMC